MSTAATENKGPGLGLVSLIALASGQVIGAGVVALVGSAIAVTGHAVWLSYMGAVVMGFCIILPYLVLSSMIRVKGGSYTFVATLLGEKWGGLFGMAFSMNVFATAMMGLGFGQYFQSIVPQANVQITGILVITVFFVFNLMGVNFLSKIQNVLSAVLICGLLLFIVTGLTKTGAIDSADFDIAAPGYFSNGLKGFFAAIVMLVYSCYGHSFVVAYSKEARVPKRDVPFAMLITTLLLLVIYSAIGLVASSVLPISDVAGKPLTLVAKQIMPLPVYYAFVVGGPLMALATTLNSSFTVFSRPLHQMTNDGWFPRGFAKTNKAGAPYFILLFVYLVAIIPIIFNLQIGFIVNNTVLIGRIADIVAIVAVITLPSRLPDAWENRYFKGMSKGLFYVLMVFSLLVAFSCIALTFNSLAKWNVVITVGLAAVFLLYAILREKTGAVKMQKSYELQ